MRRNGRLAPVVELVGWRVLSGFQTVAATVDAGGTNIVNLKFGARLLIRWRLGLRRIRPCDDGLR